MNNVDLAKFYPVSDPVDAALPYAELVAGGPTMEVLAEEESMLVRLEQLIDTCDLEGTYFVKTGRALSIPATFEAGQSVRLGDFNDLTFEASFKTYSIVQVGRLVGQHTIRALCATFDKALLLPYFERTVEDHLLHVPVLAVESISRTE